MQDSVSADPEFAIPDRLIGLSLTILAVGVLFNAMMVPIGRRFGTGRTWTICFASVILLVGIWLLRIGSTRPELLTPLWSTLYMTAVFAGVPLVVATAFINRSLVRSPDRSFWAHATRGWAGFVLGLVIGTVLGIIPDFLRFVYK
jgi:hypothetical protein